MDIAEFAPLSVKSRGDFADILAQDNPAIWISHRPAEGGETGAMFKKIIERAVALRQGAASPPAKKTATTRAAAKSAAKTATRARKAPAVKTKATRKRSR